MSESHSELFRNRRITPSRPHILKRIILYGSVSNRELISFVAFVRLESSFYIRTDAESAQSRSHFQVQDKIKHSTGNELEMEQTARPMRVNIHITHTHIEEQ